MPNHRLRPCGLLLILLVAGPSLPAWVPPGTEVGRHASNRPVLMDDITPEADLSDVTFQEGIDLSEVRFEQVDLSGAVLKGVNLERATFIKGCWKRPVDFSGAHLAKAAFQKVDIHEADFRLADLSGTDFSTSLVRQCRREGAIETGTRWRQPRQIAPAGAGDLPAAGPGAGAGSGSALDQPEEKHPRTTGKRKRDESAPAAEPPLKKPRRIPWEANLAKLLQYQAGKGHTSVAKQDDPDLSRWVMDQHSLYRRKSTTVTPERIAALEKVPTWQWQSANCGDRKPDAEVWETYLAALKAHAAAHQTTRMRHDHMDGTLPLGSWVRDQRSYKHRKHPCLTAERIVALEAVPHWEW